MLKIAIIYLLCVASIAAPPLLLLSVPVVFFEVRRIVRARRSILVLADQLEAQRRTDAIVRAFR